MWIVPRSLGRESRFRRLFIARFVSNIGNGTVALSFGVVSLPGAGATELSPVAAPLQADEQLDGARDSGLMTAAWGLGAIIGVLVSMLARPRRPLVTGLSLPPALGVWVVGAAVALGASTALAILGAAIVIVPLTALGSPSHRSTTDGRTAEPVGDELSLAG